MTSKKIEPNVVIFQEGDIADVAYLVVSGKIELSETERGQPRPTRTLGDNDIFGELAVFDPSAMRPYTAKALEPTELMAITPEEVKAVTSAAAKPIQALLALAFEKMKPARTKLVSTGNAAAQSAIKKITVTPVGDKMKAMVKPVEVGPNRLPFRIGGFPEGGEPNRRDTVHLSIGSQVNPLRVSRQHCEIAFEDNTLVVVDLGSRFCTTVNGATIGRGRGSYSAVLNMGKNTVTLGTPEGNYTLSVTCE